MSGFTIKERARSRPFRLVIEGPNASGKSTVGKLLRHAFPGAAVVELHDFYHLHALRMLSRKPEHLYSESDFLSVQERERRALAAYCKARQSSVLRLMRSLWLDDLIIERGPITYWVYMKLLFGVSDDSALARMHRNAIGEGAVVVMLTVSSDLVSERTQASTAQRPERMEEHTPFHLVEQAAILRKHSLYEEAFRRCEPLGGCHRLDTGASTPMETAQVIASLLGSRATRAIQAASTN